MLHCIDSNLDIETFNKDYIFKNKEDFRLPIISGVYILFNRSKVYYVGSSMNVYKRIKTHRREDLIRFDKFFIHPIFNRESTICNTREALLRTEKKYIEELKPRFNKVYNINR